MIPLMKNTFLEENSTKHALAEFIINSPRLSMGEKCFEFETVFAKFQGRKYATLFNSGGSANLALLQACKNLGLLKDKDKVGFSALTWSTNVMPIIQLGLEPVPVDCSSKTLNAMSDIIEKAIDDTGMKALFITNVLGFVGDLEEIRNICAAKNVILLEDNCESLGTEVSGDKAGNFSLGATFSFFVAHHMSTIEGGMLVTDDEEINEMLKIVRANGWTRNLMNNQRHKWRKKYNILTEFEDKYTFYDLGYNLRPTEITGFLGLNQIQYLESNCQKRLDNYLALEIFVKENDELVLLDRSHITMLSNFAFPVLCKTPELRDKYITQFSGAGVEIRPMIAGNITKQPFFKKYVKTDYALPETDIIHDCGFYFGNYPELTLNDLDVLGSCLRKY